MDPYQKMYLVLFHAITDALELLDTGSKEENRKAVQMLREAQQKSEELFVNAEDTPPRGSKDF